MTTKKPKAGRRVLTKRDELHYKIYRYLDNLDVLEPYLHATYLLKEIWPSFPKPTSKGSAKKKLTK